MAQSENAEIAFLADNLLRHEERKAAREAGARVAVWAENGVKDDILAD